MGMEIFINALKKAKSMDGKVIGEESEFIKIDISKTPKDAWVAHLVEQYYKHEPLDVPPKEYMITKRDFVKEVARREISKMFGKG